MYQSETETYFNSVRLNSVDDNLLRLSYFGITNPILAEKISNAFPQVKEFTRIYTQQHFNIHAPTLPHGSEIFFAYNNPVDALRYE